MKRTFLLIAAALLAAGCLDTFHALPDENLTSWPDGLHLLSVKAVYPDGYADAFHEGAPVRVEDIASGAAYTARTDGRGNRLCGKRHDEHQLLFRRFLPA